MISWIVLNLGSNLRLCYFEFEVGKGKEEEGGRREGYIDSLNK